ncbi:ribonuclease P protein component [bacterium]|nr:ribonuclease P protein component [bacterium]
MKLPTIKGRDEIISLIRQPFCASGKFFSLKNISAEEDEIKFLISISKRCGNAVRRNRIRRIIKEWCRKRYEKFSKGKRWMIVVLPSVKEISNKKLSPLLRNELKEIFKKCGENF